MYSTTAKKIYIIAGYCH